MPLVRRVPKRGFTNIFKKQIEIVNIESLEALEGPITPEVLIAAGLVKKGRPIKVLGRGEIEKPVVISANSFSDGARKKIEAAGGTCEVIDS